jgi:chromate transporter
MTVAITLFLMFFKLGFFSFGGGYTMIPLIEQQLNTIGIDIQPETISNIIAIAGISPGPVGVNLSIGFGYELGGFLGVTAAFVGVALPSLITVIIIATVFEKIYHSKYLKWALLGLKPIVVGIILYAAVNIAIKNGIAFASKQIANSSFNIAILGYHFNVVSMMVFAAAFIAMLKTKLHPIFMIVIGAVIGCLLF